RQMSSAATVTAIAVVERARVMAYPPCMLVDRCIRVGRVQSSVFLSFIAIAVTTAPAPAVSSRWDAIARDFRGALVDDAAYVMTADGGLARVRLDSGALDWRSDRVLRPLSVVGDRLLAQADPPRDGVLALAVVDVGTGEVRAALNVDLPDAVTA